MRKNYIYTFALLLFAIGSCKKEDANYTDIAQVTISKIEDSYKVLNTDLLNIDPQITIDGNPIEENKYDFIWVNLGDASISKSPENADTLGRERKLDKASMIYTSAKYEFMFRMTEKSTGIFYSKLFLVTVSSEYKDGFLVLTEESGQPRLDMVVHTDVDFYTVNDVLKKTNSALKLSGAPYFLSRLNNPFFGDKVYIGTADGTNKVDLESFIYTPSMNLAYEFNLGNFTPDNLKPTSMPEGFEYSTSLYHNNNVYTSSLGGGGFSTPVNNYGSANQTFKASKWIAPYMRSYNGNYILFDDVNQKFYNYVGGNLGCTELPIGKLFDFHIKKKLIYMAYTTNNTGEVYAVLKNNDNSKYFLATFTAGYSTNVGEQLVFDELNLPDFDKATTFAVSRSYGYLFYAVGNKLYSYDSGNKTVKLMKTYADRNITFLRVEKPQYSYSYQNEFEGQLFVGTYGGSTNSGEIEVFTPAPIQAPLELTYHFKDLGKVVDVLRLY